ncbi:MAG: PAS domain S-box protein [Thermoplasmatota archaeon]
MASTAEVQAGALPSGANHLGAPSWRGARVWLLAALAAVLVEVSTGILPLAPGTKLAVHDGLQLAAAVAAAWACIVAGRQTTGKARMGWLLLGVGAASWALGQAIWTWYEVVLRAAVPFPGWDDVAYLALYPFAIAGFLLLSPLAGHGWPTRLSIVLDGALSALAVSVLAWPLLLHESFGTTGNTLGAYVTVAYPLADILLLGLVGGILMRNRPAWRSALGLAYGAFCFVLLADLGYSTGIFQGSYFTGQISDAGWIAGFLVLAAAAKAPLPPPESQRADEGYGKLVGYALPLTLVFAGLAAFSLGARTGDTGFMPWRVSLGTLFVGAIARQALAIREYRGLERERRAVEIDYAALFANMTEGVAHCRVLYQDGKAVDLEYLRVNAQFGPLTGLHDVIGKRISQLIPGFRETDAETLALYGRVAQGGPPERTEVHVAGLARWFSITAYAAGPDEFVAVFENTTERKTVEERLRLKARLLASVGQAVIATDTSGIITYWGAGAVALYGWTAEEALGRPIVEVTPSQTSRAQAEEIMASLAAGKSWSGEFVVARKDGSSFTALVNDNPLLDDGHLVGVIGVSQDISAMKAAEERVRFQAHLLESVSQAVVATNLEGQVTYWSPAAEKLFGWSNAEAVGRPVDDLWGETLVLSPHVDSHEESPTGDYPMRRKDGSPVLVNLGTGPLLSAAGDLEGFIAVGQDATEARAQTLALRRRERALTLISAVNNELIRADSEQGLLEAICDIAVEKGGYRMAWVGLARDTPGHPVEPVAWAGHEAGYLKGIKVTWDNAPSGQITGKSIREGRTVIIRDILQDPVFAPWRDQALANGYASSISLFLPLGDDRGALMMYAPEPKAFEADEVAILEEMAGDLAFGIRALRLKTKEATLADMLNDAQELARLGAWDFDVATGRVTWTEEVFRIHEVPQGFDPGNAQRNIGFYDENDQARLDAAFRAAVERGTPYDLELRLRTAKGRLRQVRTMGLPELQDGKVARVRGNIMDITEQKEAAEALRASEETNRRFVEESPLAIVRVSRDGQFLAGNPAAVQLYGVASADALLKHNVRDFYIRTDELDKRLTEAESPHRQSDSVTELQRLDGTRFWVRSHSQPVRGADGKVAYYEGIVEDITAQRRADEARQELETKAGEVKRLEALNKMRMEFLNTAAHDLKTPLTPLKLQLATFRIASKLNPEQEAGIDLMDRNIRRFQLLVDDMLDAARLQSGRIKLRREVVDLAPLVMDAIASFAEPAKVAEVHLDAAPLPAVKVDVDPAKTMQVLLNVVSNAVKYTPAGGRAHLEVSVTPTEAIVAVKDTGLGMTADQLSRLFQPFVRLHEEMPHVAKGTGLGLYISKGIVEQHGGRIWAESEGPGKGSTFFVALPVAKTPAASPPAAPAAS